MTEHSRPPSSATEHGAGHTATTRHHRAEKKSTSPRKIAEESNPDFSLAAIGNYVFVKTLGEGNFAKVKLARHKITSQEVAIKIIDKTQLDGKKLHKLYREVRVMKLLHHPNIVCLYEVIETKSTLFLVMEYASGGELYDYLVVHGRMKEKEARVKFRQIIDAVRYCHQKRVIHRDLKAENLLLDANFDIKIADFGFSNLYDPTSKLDTFCGSPPYAAPELFQGRKYTGPEVDVWSLGVILYVLTTGCLPFDGKNLQEMRESVCRGKYRIPFYLSEGCEKLLRKFLVRDPTRRSSLDVVLDDTWLTDGSQTKFPMSPTDEQIQRDGLEEDQGIIQLLETKYHVDRESLLRSLREGLYDDVAALYYLLYHEKMKSRTLDLSLNSSTLSGTPTLKAAPRGAGKNSGLSASGNDEGGQARKRTATVAASSDYRKEHDKASQSVNYAPTALGSPNTHRSRDQKESSFDGRPSLRPPIIVTDPPSHAPHTGPQSAVPSSNSNQVCDDGHSPASARKRTSTFVGILRSRKSNASEKHSQQSAEHTSASTHGVSSTAVPGDGSKGASKPRSLRFTFSSNTTSSKPPEAIVENVIKACKMNGVEHKMVGPYLVECVALVQSPSQEDRENRVEGGQTGHAVILKPTNPTGSAKVSPLETSQGTPLEGKNVERGEWVKFEIEICKLPRLKNLHGLKFKRLSGASSDYKDVCELVLAATSL